jgi:DNA-binding transcriptional LysR family regulator
VELRQLRYFVAVAEERHFGRAAERLHIAQPGLSQQIQALERKVGAVLFDRGERPIELTAAGERLLPHARAMLEAADRALETTRDAARGKDALLKIGTPAVLTHPALISLDQTFRSRFPEVRIHMFPALPVHSIDELTSRRIDVAIVHVPFDATEPPNYLRLGELELVIVLPWEHRLASADRIPRAALLEAPFVSWPRNAAPRLTDYLRGLLFGDAEHRQVVEIPDLLPDARVRLVGQGRGLSATLVPPNEESCPPPDIVCRRLEDPVPRVEYGLAWFDVNASRWTSAFVDVAREIARKPRPAA